MRVSEMEGEKRWERDKGITFLSTTSGGTLVMVESEM